MHRQTGQLGFVDVLIGPGRSRSDQFFDAVNQEVNWSPIDAALKGIHCSPMGRPSFTPLLMFKVLLIQRWYDLSDPATEDALNDRKSFARFIGLALDQTAPDYSSISRFRTELIGRGLMASLIEELMVQLVAADMVLKQGTMMDASFVLSAAHPPSAPRDKTSKDKTGKDAKSAAQSEASAAPKAAPQSDPFSTGKRSRIDPEAQWGKKGRKAVFGYKLHIATDQERRIVRAHVVTPANVNDCEIGPRLAQPDGGTHYADKGYPSQPLRDKLAKHNLGNGIMRLGNKHYPLPPAERRRNRVLAGIRCSIEGVFGEMKQRLGLRRARYIGLTRIQLECDLVVFAFNLKTMAMVVINAAKQARKTALISA